MNIIRQLMEDGIKSFENFIGVDSMDIIIAFVILFSAMFGIMAISFIVYEIRKVKNARTKMKDRNFVIFILWGLVTVASAIGLWFIMEWFFPTTGYLIGRALAIGWILPMIGAGTYLRGWSKHHSGNEKVIFD